MYLRVFMCMCIRSGVHVCVCVYIRVHIRVRIRMHMHIHMYMHVQMHMYMYTYTHTHTHTHTRGQHTNKTHRSDIHTRSYTHTHTHNTHTRTTHKQSQPVRPLPARPARPTIWRYRPTSRGEAPTFGLRITTTSAGRLTPAAWMLELRRQRMGVWVRMRVQGCGGG